MLSAMTDFFSDPFAILLVAFLLVCGTALGYIFFSGLFTSIEVDTKEPPRGAMTVAYRTGRGPYKGAGQLFTHAYCLLPDREHVGIYYDDPDAVAEDDLRYAVGTILATGQDDPDPSEMETMIGNGYKIVHFPKPNYAVMSSFPFRTTLSIYLAIFRVYPKLKQYIASRGLCAYPALEIYTSTDIQFMMPLSRQEEFFVPEFSEEEVSIATTEFSNHPDHASVDEDVANSHTEQQQEEEAVFVKPTKPPAKKSDLPKSKSKSPKFLKQDDLSEKTSDSSSSFEDLGAENSCDVNEKEKGTLSKQ